MLGVWIGSQDNRSHISFGTQTQGNGSKPLVTVWLRTAPLNLKRRLMQLLTLSRGRNSPMATSIFSLPQWNHRTAGAIYGIGINSMTRCISSTVHYLIA